MLDHTDIICQYESMNRLDFTKRTLIVKMLTEGNSMRAASRIAGVSINTVTKLLCDLGEACNWYQDKHLRNLPCTELQMDEIWSFVGCRDKNKATAKGKHPGDVWTWKAFCPNTKLVAGWMVGDRSADTASDFCGDLSGRFSGHLQITSDGLPSYRWAVALHFEDADFAQLVKMYGKDSEGKEVCIGAKKVPIQGNPDNAKISTSLVERSNLTLRMSSRRFTRLTNGHSKKIENHTLALGLHFFVYNFCRKHTTIKTTPAVKAGITDKVWTIQDLLDMFDAYQSQAHPVQRPKHYKPRRTTPKSYEPTPKDQIPLPWYLNPESKNPNGNSN
jgi:IS1 family transposase